MDTTKIIKGVVNSGRYTVTAPIVKEDYGLYLQIEGVELPSTYEVDFSNSEHNGTSVTMIGNSDGVLIPHQFIDTGKDVFAFLYHVGADYGRTVYKFRIPNKCRPDRTDDTPTPEEQSTIDQAISALNTAVAQTAEDRENADASAQSAYESADEAQQARDNAQTYANNAQTSANNASASASQASASATASAQSASQSAQIKADVEDLVDDAQGYAQASAQSASQASASEQGCARAVLDAASAAAIARARAEEASGYAQTASAKTQDASGYASTASTKATEASQSATTASNKATEASGYATASQTAQGLAESAKDTAVQAKEDAESARDEAQSLVDGISGKVEQIESNTERIESLEDDRYKPYVTDTVSGAIASFPDGADDIPLKSLVVDIDPVQDLHGYDSPWVGGSGKNLFHNTAVTTTVNGITFTVNSDGSVTANGTATANAVLISPLNELTDGETYILNGCPSGGSSTTHEIMIIPRINAAAIVNQYGADKSFVYDSETYKFIQLVVRNGHTVSNLVFYPMIRKATEADATFSPYENICPISGWSGMVGFDDPVRGGVINWNQLAKNGNFEDTSNWRGAGSVISFTVENGEAVVVARASTDNTFLDQSSMAIIKGHKYYIGCDFKKDSTSRYLFVTTYPQGIYGRKLTSDTEGHWNIIVTASRNVTGIFRIGMRTDDPQGEWTYRIANVQFIDLTQMFGEGNEPTISEFRELFPNDYYDYNAGEKTCVSEVNDNTFKDISISFGQTVYGGKLDVLTGKLTVYPYYASYNGETLTGEWISDRDVYAVGTTPTIGAQVVDMSGTGTEVQLEAHEIASLLGANNIWADTGDTEVEYRADTRLYIEKLTQPEEDDMIADSAITSGQFFMVGNSLYRALANIASGATITVGTNAQRVSLSDALNLVNA